MAALFDQIAAASHHTVGIEASEVELVTVWLKLSEAALSAQKWKDSTALPFDQFTALLFEHLQVIRPAA